MYYVFVRVFILLTVHVSVLVMVCWLQSMCLYIGTCIHLSIVNQLVPITFNCFQLCFKQCLVMTMQVTTGVNYLLSHHQSSTGTKTICINNFSFSFKRVVEFVFQGQYEKCSNKIKCGSILNWLGVEAYPIYNNLSISGNDKRIQASC